jgi:hypothetical protein
MHAVDKVFSTPLLSEGPQHKEPLSVKKMLQGDTSWETIKIVLGWLVHTVHQTIELPPHHIVRLQTIFDELHDTHHVSIYLSLETSPGWTEEHVVGYSLLTWAF